MVNRLDPEQLERNERGIAACREIVAAAQARRAQPDDDEAQPLTRSDEILLAARQEAARRAEALNRLRRPLTNRTKEQP